MSDKRTYAYLVGARPNFIKMAPVVDAMRALRPLAQHLLIHTGQHYDDRMSRVFFEELSLPKPDFFLGVGSGSHGYQTGAAMSRIEPVLIETHTDVLVVPGDVNSTLAGALAATKLGVRVVHLESGLRSRDRSMPEEINRIVADHIADLCLVHSWSAVENLTAEGIPASRVRMVGNTMIDSLVRHLSLAEQSQIADQLGVEKGNYLLVTLHRPSLVESHDLAAVVRVLEDLADEIPVVFPVHPRTREALDRRAIGRRLTLTPPMPYLDFLHLEANARAVVTDSGGVQEETTFLGVPCLTLRNNTERPVTVTAGTNQVIGSGPDGLRDIWTRLRNVQRPQQPPDGWDGLAGPRAAAAIVESSETFGDTR
jgi:UDP-N-acetylglucosamine 2-epimerase (non-hydrolysing)